MVEALERFGDSFEAAFDLYRLRLYTELRWPLPTSAGDDVERGRQVTAYLWRGSNEPNIRFRDTENP
jgi:hypothetical protein